MSPISSVRNNELNRTEDEIFSYPYCTEKSKNNFFLKIWEEIINMSRQVFANGRLSCLYLFA